ncbi:hypothetical protein PybrP1_000611 [[Pythium] brassicae (nom. inval.)]|nr:hypothetical protein PybrP1_000611 [[Pythium] brassicae (nom. inval.)]
MADVVDDNELLARAQAALSAWGQHHVLDLLATSPPSPSSALVREQLVHFERWYRGGLDAYMRHATRLLHPNATTASQDGNDVFADWLPAVPGATQAAQEEEAPEVAAVDSVLFQELEALGAQHIGASAFVVVAGGLGERLGYHDVKLKLPVETLTHASYLERYIGHLLAFEALANQKPAAREDDGERGKDDGERVRIPLAIMTSDVTHEATRAYLAANAFFGMREGQVALIKQEKVPCLDLRPAGRSGDYDSQQQQERRLELVLEPTDAGDGADGRDGERKDAASPSLTSLLRLAMKPHGHGDVHSLLHASGLAARWQAQGKRFVHFFQDTNALIVNSFLPMLGACVRHEWAFAYTAVQRKAKDASGAIVRFCEPPAAASGLTALLNVEYHELDAFLRTKASAAFPDGDANDPRTGFSLFPGNINHFVIELASYTAVLRASGGFVPEVFNPKTVGDGATQRFKSPARLECMMQDYPKLLVACRALLPARSLSHSSRVTVVKKSRESATTGFVLFPPALVYSPCKNDVASAREKARDDIPPQCAGSAEHDLFTVNRAKLAALGVAFPDAQPREVEWLGVPLDCSGPQLVFAPRFAPSQAVLRTRFPSPTAIRISRRSTLVLEGDVKIRALELDGALCVSACAGASVEVVSLRVHNAGFAYAAVEPTAQPNDPVVAMRGYTFARLGVRELVFDSPGHYTVDEEGERAD